MNTEYAQQDEHNELTDYELGYSEKIAEHLSKHYDKGHWPMNTDWKFDKEDVNNLQNRYECVKSEYKRKYQSYLNSLMLKYLRLKKLDNKREQRITFSTFLEILHYKTVYRTKIAIRNYLYT